MKVENYNELLKLAKDFTFPCYLEVSTELANKVKSGFENRQMIQAENIRYATTLEESRDELRGTPIESELDRKIRMAKDHKESRELLIGSKITKRNKSAWNTEGEE